MSKFKIAAVWMLLIAAGACSKLCRSGYSGSECNIITRAKFEGAWNAIDTPGNLTYRDSIDDAAGIGNVLLSNAFAGHYFNNTITASAVNQTLTIAWQSPDSISKYVQGTGQLNSAGNVLSWTYQITDSTQNPALVTNYSGNWTR